MMADISALSVELRILIVEHLDRESDGTPHDQEASKLEKDTRELPKVNAALLHLSCVNRSFRSFAAPYLFRTLILRNTIKSGNSVDLIACSKYADLVKKLEFVGTSTLTYDGANGPAPRHGDWTNVALLQSVEHVLSNLSTFPKLEAFSVEFTVQADDSLGSEDDFPDNYVEIRNTHSAFMDAVYTALARNPAHKITSLCLPNLRAPSPYSPWVSWESKAWQTLLNGLTTIELGLNAEDRGWGVAIPGYCNELLPLLKSLCWDHLCSVTHLSFSPSPQGILGLDFAPMDPTPLSFATDDFPRLEVLSLDYVFMSTAFGDFMRHHAHTLREVKMQHVFVARYSLEGNGDQLKLQTTWARVFNTLTAPDVQFSNLVCFVIECTGPAEDEQDAELGQRIAELGESPKELRYALLNHVSGEVMTGFDVEQQRKAIYTTYGRHKRLLRAAEEGVQADLDQIAYKSFMQIVKGNRARLGLA